MLREGFEKAGHRHNRYLCGYDRLTDRVVGS